MEGALHLLGLVALFATCLVGIASLVIGLPGTFVIVGAALVYAWATDFTALGWTTIAWLTGLALLAEGIEFVASSAGAAAGAGQRPSRRVLVGALAGSFLGGLLGAPLLFGVGALLGALAGAFAGAAFAVATEGGGPGQAFTTGFAAFRGRLLGFVIKSAIAVIMVVVLFLAIL
jgi:outer membrane lipoprotein SlyB